MQFLTTMDALISWELISLGVFSVGSIFVAWLCEGSSASGSR